MASRRLYALCLSCVIAKLCASTLSASYAKPTENSETITENIRGAQIAGQYRFPWICSIRSMDADFRGDHYCTGALIHPRVIVTAAHCMKSSRRYEYRCGGWKRLGRFAETFTGSFSNFYAYVASGYESLPPHDISVITLDGYSRIDPPTVAKSIDAIRWGTEVCIAGWGRTAPDKWFADYLKILRHCKWSECDFKIGLTFCVRSAYGAVMGGDSGGPAFLERGFGRDIVYAVLSGGNREHASDSYVTPIYRYYELVSAKVKAAENELVNTFDTVPVPSANNIGYSSCKPSVSQDGNVIFQLSGSAANCLSYVNWNSVRRTNVQIAFDIEVQSSQLRQGEVHAPSMFSINNEVRLYINDPVGDTKWMDNIDGTWTTIGPSIVAPGSGTHKIRVAFESDGYVIYEDGMKLAPKRRTATANTFKPQLDMYVYGAGVSARVSISDIRIGSIPVKTS